MPASSATSRPSVRPWSPTCAVAAKMTSPIRSTGMPGLRRISSRTTLTAMSSARVFQKMPCGPARPNAVRTPSTNTTSRRSMALILRCVLELGPQVFELPAVRFVRLAVVLEQDRARRSSASRRGTRRGGCGRYRARRPARRSRRSARCRSACRASTPEGRAGSRRSGRPAQSADRGDSRARRERGRRRRASRRSPLRARPLPRSCRSPRPRHSAC